jgi:hypothetical protein
MAYGTHQIADLLAVSTATIADIEGAEQAIAEAFAAELAAHNALVADMLREIADVGNEQMLGYGGSSDITAVELDEFGISDAQKSAVGANVGFPLRQWDVTLQWTRLYMQTRTPQDIAKAFDGARTADLKAIQRAIRRALLTSTNNTTYIDRRMNTAVTLPIRALLNADGQVIPVGPNGEAFVGGSHTHYLATASLVAANVSALLTTVAEHQSGGIVRLAINAADEAAIRAMTANFTALQFASTVPATTTTYAEGELDLSNASNRLIGYFNGYEVWVKPWVMASYPIAYRVGGNQKPLRARTRTGTLTGLGAFDLRYEHEHYPLRAEIMSREIGFGVHGRDAAAVLYTGGGAYVIPSSF